MFKTACISGVIICEASRNYCYQATAARSHLTYYNCDSCVAQQEGWPAKLCTYSAVNSLSGSSEFWIPTHPPGVKAVAWLIGSVQRTLIGHWLLCLFSCTFPASLVPLTVKLFPTCCICSVPVFCFYSHYVLLPFVKKVWYYVKK
jgi:hypothetical protein